MSRARLFVENMLVYGLGSVIGKLVPFAMLPVVTRLMPDTAYFGLSDLTNTVVSFASAFAIMGMYDAMFRMFFEREDADFKREICSTALFFVTGMSIVVALCLVCFQDGIARLFFGSAEYTILVSIAAANVLVGSNNSIVQAPTRMQNKRRVFLVMNTAIPLVTYSLAIPLLLGGQYLVALPLAATVAAIVSLVVFAFLNRSWFSFKSFKWRHLKVLLAIGAPLMPTFLVYWVFNSADRLMIVNLMGVGAAGVYAASAKLGQVSQLLYTAFAQGWQYFAFSTMKDDDQVELTSKIYEYLGVVSFCATALLIVVNDLVFSLMFPPEYATGAVSVPYLFLAPLLLMLFQIAVNQLIVVKRTWPSTVILSSGALANVALNFLLIPVLGIEGASIATLAGYVLANAVIAVVLTRMGLLAIPRRFFVALAAFAVYFLFWRLVATDNAALLSLAAASVLGFCSFLYRDSLTNMWGRIRR